MASPRDSPRDSRGASIQQWRLEVKGRARVKQATSSEAHTLGRKKQAQNVPVPQFGISWKDLTVSLLRAAKLTGRVVTSSGWPSGPEAKG